ncbi:MAG: hypothetical protein ACPGYV_07810, partial [Phycisphaeraceae bacterium]
IARENPDRLRYQVELAESLLLLAGHDPLTPRQRQQNAELVTLDRFQREQLFIRLFDLLDRLHENNPADNKIIELRSQAQAAWARFEGADLGLDAPQD